MCVWALCMSQKRVVWDVVKLFLLPQYKKQEKKILAVISCLSSTCLRNGQANLRVSSVLISETGYTNLLKYHFVSVLCSVQEH